MLVGGVYMYLNMEYCVGDNFRLCELIVERILFVGEVFVDEFGYVDFVWSDGWWVVEFLIV